ncbi:MAG: glycosyltransferase family 39 protein [Vicinamibacteria bacterium]|nr:glycosyltransferase family 39 protein [Vicinamibacteria bacterium]
MPSVTEDRPNSRARIRNFILAAALFALALGPRLAHLDRGLRHQPEYDERIFVETTLEMMARGDWDHRFYEYPGLLIWILRIVFSAAEVSGAQAYLAARLLMAVASALTVPLLFVVAAKRISPGAGLAAGLLLALSPIEIETVHMFRPDTIIAPFLFGALACDSSGRTRLAWTLATVATALKFSAALVFAPLLASALMERTKLKHIAASCAASLALFTLLSPYTFLGGASSIEGMETQLDYHYAGAPSSSFAWMLWRFVADIPVRALSLPGLALAAWGAALGVRSRARWMFGWIAFPIFWILVFSSTGIRRDRFIVPVLSALCLLAAAGLEDLFSRARPIGYALLAVSLGVLGVGTARYLASLNHPLTMDQALDWARRTPGLETVGTTFAEIGALDMGPPELVMLRGFRGDPFVASQFDALILSAEAMTPPGFTRVALLNSASCCYDPNLALYRAETPRRFQALDLALAKVTSSAAERDARLGDGQVSTRWRADDSPAWVEVEWPATVEPTRIELAYGSMPPDRDLQVAISDDTGAIEAHSLRQPLLLQRPVGRDLSQVFGWPARPTRRLRLTLKGPVPMRIGELRVFVDAAPLALR